MSETSVAHTVREIWATRPQRRTDDRKIAGVAAAIGRRYAIDPVLVRVALVVAALFSGVGVLLYLLGWLLLPAGHGQSRGVLWRGRGAMSAALTIVLVLFLMPATRALFDGRPSGVLALAVAIGALVLLHRTRATLGELPGSPPPAQTPSPAPNATADAAEQPTPPAWDPLGVAPFAWDLPEPPSPAPTAPPRGARSTVTPITLGLTLLIGGLAMVLWPTISAAQIAALLLAVVGLGLLLGSFLQSGRGLILVAVPLALLTGVLQAIPVSDLEIGNRYWDPTTTAQVQEHYGVALGNGRLDLTGLRLTNGQTVRTIVSVGIGETHVILPSNVDAQVSCQTQLGGVDCLGRPGRGHPNRATVNDPGSAGPAYGKIILDVHSVVGQVHVERGS